VEGCGGALSLFGDEAGQVAPASVTVAPTRRLRLLVAYDGGGFHGFAAQAGVRTVGGAMAAALERHLRHTVELTCAGRTDAGVHGWGQVVSFEARADADPAAIQRALNRALRPSIVIREAEVAEGGFDARRSATSREYRYRVLNRPVPDPFQASTSWHVPVPLDLVGMRLACDPLVGEHDFSSFCRRASPASSLVRRVRFARWVEEGEGILRFEIAASAFCHQMVRSVVGTLVEVGRGKRRAGEVSGILQARARSAAGQPAPPHGLCLWSVRYDDPAVSNRAVQSAAGAGGDRRPLGGG
jgi:tRNA pseudouridine38-40 synthase